ncbi:MAG: MATE family efflux transporter [Lachnospiraceae bacterium]|nr:MATE family efflux transporter [Lachnospiraceae bacterium]
MAEIKLSDHFNIAKLLKFTAPTMIMMMFYSTYMLVDGLFISNCVGSTGYAAVNIVGNYILLFPSIGTMLGSGGAALISKTLGEKNSELASKQFSMVIWFSVVAGLLLTVLGLLTVGEVARLQGAEGELLKDCLEYGNIVVLIVVFYIVQSEFQYFFTMVEKEMLGFVSAVISGVINISLDALFILVFKWGLRGAALASFLGVLFGAIFPIVYFIRHKELPVRIKKPSLDIRTLLKVCANGSSEMVTNISVALVGMLFNFQLMRYVGENGVAAYGVIQAVTTVFLAVFQGYSAGIIPVVGYHFGAGNRDELTSLLKKSIVLLAVINVLLFGITEACAEIFAGIFVGYDKELLDMSVRGLRIYCSVFLLTSFNVFGSAFFTALNDGLNSAIISFARTIVFLVAGVLLLPLIWGLDGIWISTSVAELLALIVTISIGFINRKVWKTKDF